jgi:hypothetical protein
MGSADHVSPATPRSSTTTRLGDLEDPTVGRVALARARRTRGERRRPLVEQEDVAAGENLEPGAMSPVSRISRRALFHLGSLCQLCTPAGGERIDHEHVAVIVPALDGLIGAQEVAPPEALRLARVVVDGGRGEGECGVLGVSRGAGGACEFAQMRASGEGS